MTSRNLHLENAGCCHFATIGDLASGMWDLILLYFRVLSSLVTVLIAVCMVWIVLTVPLFFLLRFMVRRRGRQIKNSLFKSTDGKVSPVVGFFHPYCNAGGGGERVLWIAIRALQNRYPKINCIVYSGDTDATSEEILRRARQRFNITLPRPIEFIFLSQRRWVEANPYPCFTLLGQSLGSLILGWEAMMKFVPDVYIDTMGYAFTLPLFKYVAGSVVCCYTHYPTISTDMLSRVSDRVATYNNAAFVARSSVLSYGKLLYYRLFAYMYGVAGKRSEAIMVNSTWTRNHILALWKSPHKTHVLYPPCDINQFLQLSRSDDDSKKNCTIVSIAQFRPEKDHALQIKALSKFLGNVKDRKKYKLILAGSCRNEEDNRRVDALKSLSQEMEVADLVEFKLNISFGELKDLMSEADIGLHTMRDEHFGIGVVELMAAGTIVLAHDSAGPKLDIVVDYKGEKTGFLADSIDSYAEAINVIFNLSSKEKADIQRNARESVSRFSEENFEAGFLSLTEPVLQKDKFEL